MAKRLISTAHSVVEARKKAKAAAILFGDGFEMKLAGHWIDSAGNNVWDVAGSHMKVVAIHTAYIEINDSTDYGSVRVKPDPDASPLQMPEVRFYA